MEIPPPEKKTESVQDEIQRIVDLLKTEKNNTVERLNLLTEGHRKWEVINEVYKTELPHIEAVSPMIDAAGQTIHYVADTVTQKIHVKMNNASLVDIVNSGNAAMSTLMMANASMANPLPLAMAKKLEQEVSNVHNEAKDKITAFLDKVAPHLVKTYNGAWANFDINWQDAERGASALMREVVNQLLQILSTRGIKTRRQRLKYIADNMTKNEYAKKNVRNISRIYLDTIDNLSKLHKPSELNKDEVEGLLHQADNLLTIFAENIDLAKVR